MQSNLCKAVMCVVLCGCFAGPARGQGGLAKELAPLAPFVGKTWRGEFANSTPEKPVIDISRWERALNGQAVRILHSINNGEYGGETIVAWDRQQNSLIYYYFTTAGFYTHGTLRFEANKMISHEYVTGNDDGITEVKGVSELLPDGRMQGSSQYLKNGEWVDGHRVIYVEAPDAQVVFR